MKQYACPIDCEQATFRIMPNELALPKFFYEERNNEVFIKIVEISGVIRKCYGK